MIPSLQTRESGRAAARSIVIGQQRDGGDSGTGPRQHVRSVTRYPDPSVRPSAEATNACGGNATASSSTRSARSLSRTRRGSGGGIVRLE